MRTHVYDLCLELDYAEERVKQARIALATAEEALATAEALRLRHEELRACEAYRERVRQEYVAALGEMAKAPSAPVTVS